MLFLLENVFPGVVTNVFPLSYLLYPVLIFGVATALFPLPEKKVKKEVFRSTDVWLAIILSLIGAGLIYYKIDLGYPLRQVIALLAGLLILLTSLLVILPENYRFRIHTFRWRYALFLLIFIPVGFMVVSRLPTPPPTSQTIIRLAPEKYAITLINRSGNPNYSKSYQQLLINNGYTTIQIGKTDAYPSVTTTTVYFDKEDSVAGNEVAELIRQSYGVVQTTPLAAKADHSIVVILVKAAQQ